MGGGGAGYGEGKDKDDDKMDKKTLRKDKKRPFIIKKNDIYIHIGNTFSPPNSRFHDIKKKEYIATYSDRFARIGIVLSSKCFKSSSLSHNLTICAVINDHRRVIFLFFPS